MSAHEAGHIDDKSHEMEASGVFEEELSNPSDLKLSKNASKSKQVIIDQPHDLANTSNAELERAGKKSEVETNKWQANSKKIIRHASHQQSKIGSLDCQEQIEDSQILMMPYSPGCQHLDQRHLRLIHQSQIERRKEQEKRNKKLIKKLLQELSNQRRVKLDCQQEIKFLKSIHCSPQNMDIKRLYDEYLIKNHREKIAKAQEFFLQFAQDKDNKLKTAHTKIEQLQNKNQQLANENQRSKYKIIRIRQELLLAEMKIKQLQLTLTKQDIESSQNWGDYFKIIYQKRRQYTKNKLQVNKQIEFKIIASQDQKQEVQSQKQGCQMIKLKAYCIQMQEDLKFKEEAQKKLIQTIQNLKKKLNQEQQTNNMLKKTYNFLMDK